MHRTPERYSQMIYLDTKIAHNEGVNDVPIGCGQANVYRLRRFGLPLYVFFFAGRRFWLHSAQ